MDFFVVDRLVTIELLSNRGNSFEVTANDSFFGGTLITLEIGNDRLVAVDPNVEFDGRKIVFTGVFDFYFVKFSKSFKKSREMHEIAEKSNFPLPENH